MIADYFRKMAGTTQSPPRAGLTEILWSWLGAFLGIGPVAFLDGWLEKTDLLLLIGSFGASAVLIYGAIKSPLAQPRNLVGGHLISALIGVTVYLSALPLPLAGRGRGRGHQHRGDARHQDPAPARRGHRPDLRHGQPQDPSPGLSLRPHAGGGRGGGHAPGGPAGQQPFPPAPLPGILVVSPEACGSNAKGR